MRGGGSIVWCRGIPVSTVAALVLVGLAGRMSPACGDDRAAPAATATLATAAAPAPSPAEVRLKADVSFLADDAREGRAPGSSGIEQSAAYIAATFKELGLKPAAGARGYFQPFKISGLAKLGKASELAFKGPGGKEVSAGKDDLSPLAIGTGGSFAGAPVAFAGYGITARDAMKKLDYDDYAGLDAKGKAVLVFRRQPQQDRNDSPFGGKTPSSYATLRHKATNAFQHGAAVLLLVNDAAGTNGGKDDTLVGFLQAGNDANSSLPIMMITRALADKLLAGAGAPSLTDLEKQIDTDLKPRSRVLEDWTATGKADIDRTTIETRNVVGVLEGAGPRANETVVVGAHYDHLGRGGLFSGSLSVLSRDIHNGADDNASGTSMVLEMARRLGRRADPLPRRVVFIAFSGEERGLLGSQHYVEHPLYPLNDTVLMVNFDMVGRLNDKNELTVYGTGTSPGFAALVDTLGKAEGFTVKKIADGFGPSDQQSFYVKDIPVLFAFTGTHPDYHRPSDDTERINFAGMARIADLGELFLLELVRRPTRPAFVKVAAPQGHGAGDPGRVAVTAYLGSIPDYNDDIKGVKLNGVREGSPAEKGGLRKDDVIVGFGGKPIGTIYDYTDSLGRYKPGDTVEIVVKRAGTEVKLKVTLGTKPGQ
jgi:hypothetical protein